MIRKERVLLRLSEPNFPIKVIGGLGREHKVAQSVKRCHNSRETCPIQSLLGLNLYYSAKAIPQNCSKFARLERAERVPATVKCRLNFASLDKRVPDIISPLLLLLSSFMEPPKDQVNHSATYDFANLSYLCRSSITYV